MPVSLTNNKDIVADSVSVISGNNVIDLGDGLVDVGSALGTKANQITTYTKIETDYLLNTLSDNTTAETIALKANITDVNAALVLKADKADTYKKQILMIS